MALSPTEEAQTRDLIAQQAALLSLAGVEPTILSKLGATKVTLSDLPTASAINDADLLLLRQGVTDKSVTGLTFKGLIPTIADASETVKGIVELATNAEVIAGTDTVRAITSAGLQSKVASETALGIVELATDSEARAFTANKFIDGAKLNTALKGSNQSLAASGYQKFPGGLIVQWGKSTTAITAEGATTITFPIAFPNSCLVANAIGRNSDSSADKNVFFQVVSTSNTQLVIFNQVTPNSPSQTTNGYEYFAIGY